MALSVLLVEDSAMVAKRIAAMMSEAAEGIHLVGEAYDVPGAMDAVRETHPDVVVLDIRIPGGSGIDVLQFIKEDFPNTIVMMFTNYPYPEYRQKCLASGADFFFDKSTEFDKVRETLQQLHRDSQVCVPRSASVKSVEEERR